MSPMKITYGSLRLDYYARVTAFCIAIIAFAGSHSGAQQGTGTATLSAAEATAIATDAYIYGSIYRARL